VLFGTPAAFGGILAAGGAVYGASLLRVQRRRGRLARVLVRRRLQAHRGERPTRGAAPALANDRKGGSRTHPLAVMYPVPVPSIESSMPAERRSMRARGLRAHSSAAASRLVKCWGTIGIVGYGRIGRSGVK
jgi:hypothetical protein